jgi:hypothetical protein
VPADGRQGAKSSSDTDLVVFSLCSMSLADAGGQKDHGFYVLAGQQCVPRDAGVLEGAHSGAISPSFAQRTLINRRRSRSMRHCCSGSSTLTRSLAVRRKPDFPMPAGLSVSRKVAKGCHSTSEAARHRPVVPSRRGVQPALFSRAIQPARERGLFH